MSDDETSFEVGDFTVKLKLLQTAMIGKAPKALQTAAEYLLEEANRKIPHAEGTLQDSGKAVTDTAELVAAVYYDTPYAKAQHENTSYHHPIVEGQQREAKWLENAMNRAEVQDNIRTIITKTLRP